MSTAHGALIVQEAQRPPHQYDDDIVLLMADHYSKDDHTMEKGLLSDPFKWTGEPDAVTLQGQSGNRGFGDASDNTCAPHVIYVEPCKRYRVRAIGATILSLVKIGIEDHSSLKTIEADGLYTTPVPVDHIQVASGQRFSFLLETKTAEEICSTGQSQFWIRYESRERPKSISGYALLKYQSLPCAQQDSLPPSLPETVPLDLPQATNDYLEYALEPASADVRRRFPRLSEVTRTVTIQVNQKLTTGEYINGSLNGSLEWV